MIFFLYNLKILMININYNIKLPELSSINNYKKSITTSKFLNEIKISKVFNNKLCIFSKNLYNDFSLTNINNLILEKITLKNAKNELLFLLNKNIKIYIHIEQLFYKTNIYHIGVSFKSLYREIRYDIRGYNIDNLYNLLSYNLYSKTIFWDYTNKTIEEIIVYEKNLDYKYILGIYDCRHYVKNLTKWSCDKPSPVWKLSKLIN